MQLLGLASPVVVPLRTMTSGTMAMMKAMKRYTTRRAARSKADAVRPLGSARARDAMYVAAPVATTTPLPLPDTTDMLCMHMQAVATQHYSVDVLVCGRDRIPLAVHTDTTDMLCMPESRYRRQVLGCTLRSTSLAELPDTTDVLCMQMHASASYSRLLAKVFTSG